MFKEKLKQNKHPYLCTPIVGRNRKELMEEIENVKIKNPDIIEWRADYFQEIHDFHKVVEVADAIKQSVKNIPLLFTIRSEAEGGNPITLSASEIVELLTYVCKTDAIDLIDYEIANSRESIFLLRKISQANEKLLILSYHNYDKTPANQELLQVLNKAEILKADIAKIAVMPNSHADVLRLLEVTNQANENLNIPVATMSLGSIGALSRMVGWVFGSVITFTVGANSSAPGQIPIEEMQKLIKTVKEYQQ